MASLGRGHQILSQASSSDKHRVPLPQHLQFRADGGALNQLFGREATPHPLVTKVQGKRMEARTGLGTQEKVIEMPESVIFIFIK